MSEEKRDTAEADCSKKYPLVLVRGLPLPAAPIFSPSNVENAIDFKPQDTDIFVVTYPKCGTTWTQYIVWEILHKGAVPPSPNRMLLEFPFLEFIGVQVMNTIPPPRTMKTHLPFNLQPFNPKAKYIYIVRNPWDCCVSYYYHQKLDTSLPELTFDEHFELFIRGEVPWGDFFDHVLSWFGHRNDANVLFLTYESMKKDKRKTLLAIAKFLGDDHYEDVSSDDEVLENCLKHSDFKYMKEMGLFFPKGGDANLNISDISDVVKIMSDVDRSTADAETFREVNFFRKGEIGDWKNYFSPNQIRRFNDYMLSKLKNTELENFWKPQLEETVL